MLWAILAGATALSGFWWLSGPSPAVRRSLAGAVALVLLFSGGLGLGHRPSRAGRPCGRPARRRSSSVRACCAARGRRGERARAARSDERAEVARRCPRLRAPDARPDPEPRRRPGRGEGARTRPGARPARSAVRRGTRAREPALDRRGAARGGRRGRGRAPGEDRRRHRGRRAARRRQRRRSWPRRARRSSTPPSTRPMRRCRCSRRSTTGAWPPTCATAAPASTSRRSRQDRRGVRDSIVARMVRHGGHAAVRTAPGGGCEVRLVQERTR